jgi:uncharacterized protein with PIN domain
LPADRLFVLDACAIIALLQDEPGGDVLADILSDPGNRCQVHAINACEVYYDLYRRQGEDEASSLESILETAGIEVVTGIPRRSGELPARSKRNGDVCLWPTVSP